MTQGSARRAALLAVTALLAIPAAAGAATFGPATVVSGDDAGEPSIDISNADGTMYINAPAGFLSNLPGSASFVYRSTNGGASWTKLPAGARQNLPGGGDSDISLDPKTGALAMTDLWLGSATVSKSTDKGQTWSANPLQGIVVQDREWVANAGGGTVYHVTHQIPLGLVVSKSVDGGLTYPLQGIAATPLDQTGCICPPGTMVAEAGTGLLGTQDRVGVVYATSTGGVNFARSVNGGLSFSSSAVSSTSGADTAIAFPIVANAGGSHLVAAWQQNQDGRSVVKFSDSRNWGASWSSPRTLVSSGASAYPWIDARGSKVAVSVYHTDDAQSLPGNVPESARWFESELDSSDGGTTFSGLTNADPTAVKTGPICQEGTSCAGDRELLDFQAVAVDPQGRPNLTWTRSLDGQTNTELRFVRGS